MVRFQVRKLPDGRWETSAMLGRSWVRLDTFASFRWAMALATGQSPYGDDTLGRMMIAVAK